MSRPLPCVVALAWALAACATDPAPPTVDPGGGGTGGAPATTTSTVGSDGGHGCFSTETTCDGKCVDVATHPEHCGGCGNRCATGPEEVGVCVDGVCSATCAPGFAEVDGACGTFFGAHETYPAACAGCQVANSQSGGCACPDGVPSVDLAVQSDCPGQPMRAEATLSLCMTDAQVPGSDFGGAFQEDDVEGWCGAEAGCRVGNPRAGGACACPDGTQPHFFRSIVRLPCGGAEAGTRIAICLAPEAPPATVAGAYQYDDFEPRCRVPNPRTGDCSCSAGTADHTFRVMVDGTPGLYGSTLHLCLP